MCSLCCLRPIWPALEFLEVGTCPLFVFRWCCQWPKLNIDWTVPNRILPKFFLTGNFHLYSMLRVEKGAEHRNALCHSTFCSCPLFGVNKTCYYVQLLSACCSPGAACCSCGLWWKCFICFIAELYLSSLEWATFHSFSELLTLSFSSPALYLSH